MNRLWRWLRRRLQVNDLPPEENDEAQLRIMKAEAREHRLATEAAMARRRRYSAADDRLARDFRRALEARPRGQH